MLEIEDEAGYYYRNEQDDDEVAEAAKKQSEVLFGERGNLRPVQISHL